MTPSFRRTSGSFFVRSLTTVLIITLAGCQSTSEGAERNPTSSSAMMTEVHVGG